MTEPNLSYKKTIVQVDKIAFSLSLFEILKISRGEIHKTSYGHIKFIFMASLFRLLKYNLKIVLINDAKETPLNTMILRLS